MATLKQVSIRLKSVKNIQKITQSMKMVAAAKYAKAERELKLARPYGNGSQAFFQKVEAKGQLNLFVCLAYFLTSLELHLQKRKVRRDS